ncbi:MAG: hypothetical protein JSR25_04395 [Proteobacteria bacterium]|nr:hypothetical protein [Pseudomonadota bacterium]
MAFAGTVVEVFDFPAAAQAPAIRDDAALLELEFSDYGRDARFLPGWYILPSIVGGVLVIASLII